MAEVFISSRYTPLAKPPRNALITQLRARGVPVWDGVCTGDVVREVSRKLDATPLSIVLGTADYAEDTGVDGNTYTEIQLIKDSQKEDNKPFLFVKMCTRFTFMSARVILPPSTIHDFQWLPNADGSFGSPPAALVDLIVQKYQNLVGSSLTISSVTARVAAMHVQSNSNKSSRVRSSLAVPFPPSSFTSTFTSLFTSNPKAQAGTINGEQNSSPSATIRMQDVNQNPGPNTLNKSVTLSAAKSSSGKPMAPAGSEDKLHQLIQQNKHVELLAFVTTYNVSSVIDAKKNGHTPLHTACWSGCVECVQILLDHGANISTPNSFGQTPLQVSCTVGHTDCLKLLLHHGAYINTKNTFGHTLLHIACRSGRVGCLILLLECGLHINTADRFGQTPLYSACDHGHAQCAKLLLDHGANINFATKFGQTPLYSACDKGHAECVKLLLDHGANAYTYTYTFTPFHLKTPLMIATENSHVECVNLLLAYRTSSVVSCNCIIC